MTPSRAHTNYHIYSRWSSQVYVGEGKKTKSIKTAYFGLAKVLSLKVIR